MINFKVPERGALVECIKEAPCEDTQKIRIWGQKETLESREDLLTPTVTPLQLRTRLDKVDKDVEGDKLMGEDMSKLRFTEDILGQNRRKIIVLFNYLLR